jgi:protein SCO1
VRKPRIAVSLQWRSCKYLIAAASIFSVAATPLCARESAGLPPPPGSYTLDHIQRVPQAIVLEGTRFPRLLSSYTAGAITLFGFFYSYCADPNGCPLAWNAFEQMREEIISRPELRAKVRLVFMSLDPQHDTPDVLKGFARRYEATSSIMPWHFLTTYSDYFLKPLLREMGEEISVDREAQRSGKVILHHLLKVFLIDKKGWVREIYSNQSLDPAMILDDIQTLLLEKSDLGGP